MPDRHLEAAVEAVEALTGDAGEAVLEPEDVAAAAVDAYLDSLLGELPEEAVEAAARAIDHWAAQEPLPGTARGAKVVLTEALQSLRDTVRGDAP